MFEAGVEEVAGGGLVHCRGDTEGGGSGLVDREVNGRDVVEGGDVGGLGCGEAIHGDAGPGAFAGYGVGSVVEGACAVWWKCAASGPNPDCCGTSQRVWPPPHLAGS